MCQVKKLGKANYEKDEHSWKFDKETGTDKEIANGIADYFANISSKFLPIDLNLTWSTPSSAPFVSEVQCFPQEHEIYLLLKK